MFFKNRIAKFIFNNLLAIFILILLLEAILQITFKFENQITKQPVLFYNPYCEQDYWYNVPEVTIDYKKLSQHPILSYVDKRYNIPKNFNYDNNLDVKNSDYDYIFYGSSFVGHDFFKKYLIENKINSINYALSSYGIGQIALNYKLTANLYKNKKIVIGFLLEDLDRVIMHKRNYNKIKYVVDNNIVKLVNYPVSLNKIYKPKFTLYSLKFVYNFFNLYNNNFDPRMSECRMKEKKIIFEYLIQDINETAKIYNQKVEVILFNYLNDFKNEPSWRYNYIKEVLDTNQISYIDSIKILNNNNNKKKLIYSDLYGSDLHYNYKGFQKILNFFFKL